MELTVALDGEKKRDLRFFAGDDMSLTIVVYAHDGDINPITVTNVRFAAAEGSLPMGSEFVVPLNFFGRVPYRIVGEVADITTTLAYGVMQTEGGWPSLFCWCAGPWPYGVVGKSGNITVLDEHQNFESPANVESALEELGDFKKATGDIPALVDTAVQAASDAEAAAQEAIDTLDSTVKKPELAAADGATTVGSILNETGAEPLTAAEALSLRYNLWNFLSAAERADSLTGTPAIDVSAKINIAIARASSAGRPLDAFGTYRVGAQKIVFTNDADFSRATFLVYGSPAIALEISTGSAANPTDRLFNKVIRLPKRTENMGKPATGWAGQGIGVRTVNTYSCEVHTGNIVNFSIGFQETSFNVGNVYNRYFLGYLENNMVNLDLIPGNAAAWVNENHHFDGRLDHYSLEGTNVAGTRCIRLNKAANAVNNHLFEKPSMEGNVAEYQLENAGTANRFVQGRWEATVPKVLYTGDDVNQGSRNVIDGGYQSANIVFTYTGTTGGLNKSLAPGAGYESTNLGTKTQNQSSSTSPIQTFYEAGTRPEAAAAGDWAMKHSAFYLEGKRQTDAFARLRVEYQTGRIYAGTGTAAPTSFIGPNGAAAMGSNVDFTPMVDGTTDLGLASYRWRNLRLTGAVGFFGATALGAKPAVTGSRGGNAALASLLTQLASYGLITDSTTA